jgi:hypothetical protein
VFNQKKSFANKSWSR